MEISAIKDSLPGLGRCSCLLCPLLPPLLQPLWLKYLNSYMGSKRNFLWMDGAAVNDANANYLLIFLALQGTGHCTKMDNFFRELPKGGGGGGHFWSNNLYCRFCNFKQSLLRMKLIQKNHVRAQPFGYFPEIHPFWCSESVTRL